MNTGRPTPTLKQLRYLVTVADELHFSAAADLCRVSQPTLSSQVRALEELLGAQLLERSSRSVSVTPIGEQVVAQAREVLREVDELVALTQDAGEPLTGTVRLGVIPTIAPYLLPRVLPGIRARYPELTTPLREDLTERLMEELRADRLDAALVALPIPETSPATRTTGMEIADLGAEPFVLATPPDHALAGRADLRQRDLADAEVLLLEEGHCLRQHALEACGLSASQEAREFRATSMTTLLQMVSNGAGATLVPLLACDTVPPDVVTTEFADPPPVRRLGLVWRRSHRQHRDLRLLAAEIGEAIRRLLVDDTG